MRHNSLLISSRSRLTKSNSNFTHLHILCPYKFCTCFCTMCNSSFSVCSCICHSKHQKTRVNSLSIGRDSNNISDNIILSNYSTNIIQKTKQYLQFKNGISSNINEDSNNDISSNQNNLNKKIFHDKLYKNNLNYNGRSLSEINLKRNHVLNRKPSLYKRESYLNKYNMNNLYTNSEGKYNYNYDNKKLLLYSNPLTERDNSSYSKYLNKNKEENKTNKNNIDKNDEKLNRYFYRNNENDSNNINNQEKTCYNLFDKSKKQYLNNYFRKKIKNKSSLNSPKKAKIREIIIKSKINKNEYNAYAQNKNTAKDEKVQIIKKYKKDGIKNESKESTNKKKQASEFNKLIYNNYLSKLDKINHDKQINRNRNRPNILNQNKNKTSYFKFNNNLNNIKENSYKARKTNYIKDSKKDKLKIYSFSFSFVNNNNIIEKLQKEILEKNQEILEYKNKFISMQKELEIYKNQILLLKQNHNNYLNNKIKKEDNRLIYKKKNQEDRNNIFKRNYNYINDENYFNENNSNEIQFGLSSKLKLKTDLNIDNEYYLSFNKYQLISDKCIFAISSLTKFKSFLCFDYTKKSFSFKDFADFGDFQENYIKSLDNISTETQKNKSLFLTINYNFYIITGENCDIFYVFDSLKRTINKLCSLKNNHSNGLMLNFKGDIICIGGNYNKKVELYIQSKNEWIDLPELQIERSNFSAVIFKNKYLFCLLGYNLPTKQYLNTIEYLDIENYNNSSWKYLKYKNENLLQLNLIHTFAINYINKKIIIVGGKDEQNNLPNEYFYQLIINDNFENNKDSYIEKTRRKLKDINKNKCYLFNKGHHIFSDNKNLIYMAFDNDLRVHLFHMNNMVHDLFYFK